MARVEVFAAVVGRPEPIDQMPKPVDAADEAYNWLL